MLPFQIRDGAHIKGTHNERLCGQRQQQTYKQPIICTCSNESGLVLELWIGHVKWGIDINGMYLQLRWYSKSDNSFCLLKQSCSVPKGTTRTVWIKSSVHTVSRPQREYRQFSQYHSM